MSSFSQESTAFLDVSRRPRLPIHRQPSAKPPEFRTRAETLDHYAALLQSIIDARGKRYEFFPSELFVDPAWDILLHAALAQEQQRRITVTALCAAVNVPDTTAARWIRHMVDKEILVRRDAPTDARIKYIELSVAAAAKLRLYLRSISEGEPV